MTAILTNVSQGAVATRYGLIPPQGRQAVPFDYARVASMPELRITYLDDEDSRLAFKNDLGWPTHVGLYGPIGSTFGYAGAAQEIVNALDLNGVRVTIERGYEPVQLDRDTPQSVRRQGANTDVPKYTLCHSLPDTFAHSSGAYKIAWTMWETSVVPSGSNYHPVKAPFGNWPALINDHCEALIVPCQHNADVFYECGVNVPIAVIPYGIDPTPWPWLDRSGARADGKFRVTLFGDLTDRKGPREAVHAFQTAFQGKDDVELVLKTQYGHLGAAGAMAYIPDPRVRVINETWTRAQLLALLSATDCFVWPSRGEGFGLPPLQALLTGCPVVTTTHTGMETWFSPKYAYGVETAGRSPAPLYGEWLDPSVDSLVEGLLKVYYNRKVALKKAKSGSDFIRSQFSPLVFGGRLVEYLRRFE